MQQKEVLGAWNSIQMWVDSQEIPWYLQGEIRFQTPIWPNMGLFLPTVEYLGYLENVYPTILRVWLSGTPQLNTNNIQVLGPVWTATELGNSRKDMEESPTSSPHLRQPYIETITDRFSSFFLSVSIGGFLKCGSQTSSIGITWVLVKKQIFRPFPDLLNQNLWGWD